MNNVNRYAHVLHIFFYLNGKLEPYQLCRDNKLPLLHAIGIYLSVTRATPGTSASYMSMYFSRCYWWICVAMPNYCIHVYLVINLKFEYYYWHLSSKNYKQIITVDILTIWSFKYVIIVGCTYHCRHFCAVIDNNVKEVSGLVAWFSSSQRLLWLVPWHVRLPSAVGNIR